MSTSLRAFPGMQFRPHNTDSVGTVARVIAGGHGGSIEFSYEHAPEKSFVMSKSEFTDRFAEPVGKEKR